MVGSSTSARYYRLSFAKQETALIPTVHSYSIDEINHSHRKAEAGHLNKLDLDAD